MHELIELMKIEGDILAIRAKINVGAHDFGDLSKLDDCLHRLTFPGYYERRNTDLYKEISDASTRHGNPNMEASGTLVMLNLPIKTAKAGFFSFLD